MDARGRTDCLLIGLDCGTQSAKACVWSLDGTPVARAEAGLHVAHPREGWAEQDPGEWWASARQALRAAARGIDAARLAGLGVAFQRETFTLEDRSGRPLRPGILWLDIRAHAQVRELERSVGASG